MTATLSISTTAAILLPKRKERTMRTSKVNDHECGLCGPLPIGMALMFALAIASF
jgi:hypothetical protein